MMKVQSNKKYAHKEAKTEVEVVSIYGDSDNMYVKFKQEGVRGTFEMHMNTFAKNYVELSALRNVNKDIMKLISAGYEFKSFFGDTLDGRSISLDLNEEGE